MRCNLYANDESVGWADLIPQIRQWAAPADHFFPMTTEKYNLSSVRFIYMMERLAKLTGKSGWMRRIKSMRCAFRDY